MSQIVRGVVARAKGAEVSVEDVVVPDPGLGEAVVKILTCGVCHTDLHYKEGGIGDDYPFLLGHEAAGIVERTGQDVTEVFPGDFVVLNWRAVCGECRACRRGRPWYCFNTFNAKQKMTLTDGTPLTPALGIGAFAEKTLVAAGQCTKVDPLVRPAAVGLLGCGVMAGIGAALNTGGVTRGDSVVVIGCGGVGLAAVAGARLASANTIIAVDPDDDKLSRATYIGATHTINPDNREVTVSPIPGGAPLSIIPGIDGRDVVGSVRALTGGFGVDVAIDAVGTPETWKQAFYARDLAGTVVLVGVPTAGMELPDIPFPDIFSRGGALKASWYGDCLPSRDIPFLVDLYRQKRLDLDTFISELIPLDDVEGAFTRMKEGKVLRSVVDMTMARRVTDPYSQRFPIVGSTLEDTSPLWEVPSQGSKGRGEWQGVPSEAPGVRGRHGIYDEDDD
jgi:S-(hydroxymethyl)mycothiol dehydrogenase